MCSSDDTYKFSIIFAISLILLIFTIAGHFHHRKSKYIVDCTTYSDNHARHCIGDVK